MDLPGRDYMAISCGHIGGELISLASMLRVPVDMHNVPSERVFRPSACRLSKGLEPQAADYLACKTYGPLHG